MEEDDIVISSQYFSQNANEDRLYVVPYLGRKVFYGALTYGIGMGIVIGGIAYLGYKFFKPVLPVIKWRIDWRYYRDRIRMKFSKKFRKEMALRRKKATKPSQLLSAALAIQVQQMEWWIKTALEHYEIEDNETAVRYALLAHEFMRENDPLPRTMDFLKMTFILAWFETDKERKEEYIDWLEYVFVKVPRLVFDRGYESYMTPSLYLMTKRYFEIGHFEKAKYYADQTYYHLMNLRPFESVVHPVDISSTLGLISSRLFSMEDENRFLVPPQVLEKIKDDFTEIYEDNVATSDIPVPPLETILNDIDEKYKELQSKSISPAPLSQVDLLTQKTHSLLGNISVSD